MTPSRIPIALLLAAALAACRGAAPPTAVTEEPSPAAADPTSDPRQVALAAEVERLAATLMTARELLAAAQETGDRDAAAAAVAVLTADDRLAGEVEPPADPLFPGPDASREETIDYGDLLTRTLTAARDAGGAGQDVLRVLADPLAGDLGSWQRDARGMLDAVAAAADGDVDSAETAILELPGDGTRALAWALFAARQRSEQLVRAGGERAIAHLDLVIAAVDRLTGT